MVCVSCRRRRVRTPKKRISCYIFSGFDDTAKVVQCNFVLQRIFRNSHQKHCFLQPIGGKLGVFEIWYFMDANEKFMGIFPLKILDLLDYQLFFWHIHNKILINT